VERLLRSADRALYQEKRRRDTGSREAEPATPGALAKRPYEARPIEILLVENDPNDADLTRRALGQARLQNRLSVVADGSEALAFLRGEPPFETATAPDVVLLDLDARLKDGRALLKEMRQDPELREVPVVVLTATHAERRDLEALEPDAFLTKPVDFPRLAQAVRSVANLGFTIVKLSA
jgi:CheY-like chemotaxis protein